MFEKIRHNLFPSPRQPVSWRSAVPLAVFLLLFGGLCIGLEATDTLQFTNPGAFALLIALVWVWWMSVAGFNGLSRKRAQLALWSRFVLVGLLVMVIAEPRAVRTSDVVSVVYAMDLSSSIGEGSTDKATEFILRTVGEKPEKDEAGLVAFGGNAAVELPPRTAFPFEAINSRIDRDATDLQQSLSLAAAMLPEDTRGRIVLISDGTETSGDVDQVLDDLVSRGIAVDVLPVQYEYDREVWIERLELPQFVKIGEPYEAAVVLSSLQADEGTLVLRENGQPIYEEKVEFDSGKSRFTIPIRVREPGYYEYSATISVGRGRDHLRENNTVLNYIFVEGEGKVLVVTDPLGDEQDWESFVEATRQGRRIVETMEAYDFPRDPLSLMPYDAVVFVNVGQDAFDRVQLQSLHDAVYNQGIGFLMIGGANSYGPGGYHRSVVEQALPVTMDITKKKILPKGALVIILHTCEFPEGNTWGKRITKQAIRVLGDQDEVGVITYGSGGEGWLFELTPASEYESMVPKINGALVGDMPAFGPTMEIGLEGLKKSDASAKHMIIISDGDPTPPPPNLVKDFVDSQVTVSMVAVFPHGGQEISLMREISAQTGGRYYFPSDPNELPAIFIKESKTLKRSMIQNKTVEPAVGYPSQVLDGIEATPPLHGYVLTSAKPRAENVLVVNPDEAEGETADDIDPLLAIWRYGLATTAAFTSDLSTNWGKDWVSWESYRAFVTQLMTRISRVRQESHLKLWTYTAGGEGVIMVEDFHPDEMFLDVAAQVNGPNERAETIALKQVGPRRYQASVPLWGEGRYQVTVAGQSGERTDRAYGGFIMPYSAEYLRFRSNPIVLDEIRERTGGEWLSPDTTSESIYNRREPKRSSKPIFDWLLIALCCVLPLDVALRRVQLDWYTIKSWFVSDTRAESTQTMGALLARKETVSSRLKGAAVPRPSTSAAAKTMPNRPAAARRSQPARPKPEQRPTPQPSADASTTSRLLEMKRRRQESGEE